MRAAVLSEIGGPLVIEELAPPVPGPGEVLLDVVTCGVCHSDLHVMKGEIAFPLPAVLGHEVCGVVRDVGPGVAHVRIGWSVVTSFVMPCGACARCARGEEDLCETFFRLNRLRGVLYDGTSRLARLDGSPVWMYSMAGLAEQCVVPATSVFAVPEPLALENLATLGCSGLTAYGAIRNVADVRPGDSVAVVAVGGVGSSLVQLSCVFGASQVIAVDVSDAKLEAARALGATDVVNSSGEDPVEAVLGMTGGRGVDVAFEALGSPGTFATATALVADGGRVVVIGIAPSGAQGTVDLPRLVRRKLKVLGSYGGRPRTDMPALLDLVRRGVYEPGRSISRRLPLARVSDAYQALAAGAIVGRAVIDVMTSST
jgi:succinate semialdehyde reductase (NADPH)